MEKADLPGDNSTPTLDNNPAITIQKSPKKTTLLKLEKWFEPLIVIVIILSIGLSGFLGYRNYQLKKARNKQRQSEQILPPTPEPSPSEEEIQVELDKYKDEFNQMREKMLDKELKTEFEDVVLSQSGQIAEEFKDKQITKIFKKREIYIIRTEPFGYVQTLTFSDNDAINIYLVNKNTLLRLLEKDHDVATVAEVYDDIENPNRLIVQIGGGAHVSNLFLIDISGDSIRKINFTDPSDLLSSMSSYEPSIVYYSNGSTHAEEFEIDGDVLYITDWAVTGKYGKRTISLENGQLLAVEKVE